MPRLPLRPTSLRPYLVPTQAAGLPGFFPEYAKVWQGLPVAKQMRGKLGAPEITCLVPEGARENGAGASDGSSKRWHAISSRFG